MSTLPPPIPVRVYVCGASYEPERAAVVIALLEARGIVVTHDWTIQALSTRGHGGDAALSAVERWRATVEDLTGVDRAHLILWLVPEDGSTGAGFEVGYAFRAGIPIVACGPFLHRSIFTVLASTSATTDAGGVEVVARVGPRVARGEYITSPTTSGVRYIR